MDHVTLKTGVMMLTILLCYHIQIKEFKNNNNNKNLKDPQLINSTFVKENIQYNPFTFIIPNIFLQKMCKLECVDHKQIWFINWHPKRQSSDGISVCGTDSLVTVTENQPLRKCAGCLTRHSTFQRKHAFEARSSFQQRHTFTQTFTQIDS